jgi:hypothetical protein
VASSPGGRPITARSDLAGAQQLQQRLAVAGDAQADVDAGMLVAEAREQAGQEVLRGADHADRQQPGLQLAQARHRVLRVLQRREQALGVDEEVLAGGAQGHGAALPLEQRQPDLALDLLDLHRDRRRRQVQRLRGAREAEVAGDLGEDAQLAKGDVHSGTP